jgi:hypothetical protein
MVDHLKRCKNLLYALENHANYCKMRFEDSKNTLLIAFRFWARPSYIEVSPRYQKYVKHDIDWYAKRAEKWMKRAESAEKTHRDFWNFHTPSSLPVHKLEFDKVIDYLATHKDICLFSQTKN